MSRRLRRLAALLSLLAVAAVAVWWGLSRGRLIDRGASGQVGRNRLENTGEGRDVGAALSQMSWNDIAPTIAGIGAQPDLRMRTMSATALASREESAYLRALLLLSENQPEKALAVFQSIPTSRIPPGHLYAPFRLHEVIRKGQPNPYFKPLADARRAGSLSSIVAARIAAVEADLYAALRGYVASDPAQWATQDLVVFRALRLHAALGQDTTALLVAALRGGRVPGRLQPEISRILASTRDVAGPDLQAALRASFQANPELRKVAATAFAQQIRTRGLFVSRKYSELIDQHRRLDYSEIPDGSLVLLVIAASRVGDGTLVDRWAQEIRRRYPDPEVVRWLHALPRSQP